MPKRAVLTALVAAVTAATGALAQTSNDPSTLPVLTIEGQGNLSLTVPGATGAQQQIEQTPGAVEVVPAESWQATAATTLKDVLDYTPGVFVQPKWGEDSRLSIRGSGLSRNFHMRGIALYQDGIPINASDGGGDMQELDPTAFGYAEVWKGGNALRYGAATLGGAINFVSPTGHDADLASGRLDFGSFGMHRLQASSGAAADDFDAFVTGSWLSQDGYRDHSKGEAVRASGNVGWRISETIETRFFFSLADIWQEIPGAVTKQQALNDPQAAAPGNLLLDYQRNMQSWRLANKTAVQLDRTLLEFGGYALGKQLQHPIFQYLDYDYWDFGGFVRATDERRLFGLNNRAVVGVNLSGGWVDNQQYQNLPGGFRGTLLSESSDRSLNLVVYGENALEILPRLSLVLGLQYVHAVRDRVDEFPGGPDTSGRAVYDLLNPKAGLLWQGGETWQVFANVSRSGEPPTFSELNFTNVALEDLDAQRATTLEIGSRGSLGPVDWDVALYRAQLRNEFQFFDLGGGNYQVTNADRTIHQGIEAAVGWSFWQGLLRQEGAPDDLYLRAAYTFSDFRFDDDAAWGDNRLPGAPEHFLRAELLYRHPDGFWFGPNVEWVPEAYYVDNANTVKTEPYALLGFRAGYDIGEHVSLFLEARNLLDAAYIASPSVVAVANPSSAIFEPGNGRAVYGGIRLSW